MLALFRNRSYACFWSAGVVTSLGDAALAVGLPIYLYLLTHSVLATGALFIAKGLMALLMSPAVGVLVDRWDRKRVLVVGNAILSGIVLLLLFVRTPSLAWIVYVTSALITLVAMFLPVAASGVMPTLVPPEELARASSLGSISGSVSHLVGPALGGWLAAKHGLAGLVLFDSATFVVAAVLTALVTMPPRPPRQVADFRTEWTDGMRTLFGSRTLRLLVLGFGIVAIGDSAFQMLWPVFVARVLHGGAEESGLLLTADAVGGLLGGFAVALLGRRIVSGRVIGLACLVYSGLLCAVLWSFPVTSSFKLELALLAACGFTALFFGTGLSTLFLLSTPDSHRGRVGSSMNSVALLVGLVGMGAATLVTDRIGIAATMTSDAAVFAIAGVLALVLLPSKVAEVRQ